MNLTAFLTQLSEAHDHAIPFEVFMREALYHPEFGYYTANIETVGGRHADFSTSATLLPDLSKAIAVWIQEEVGATGSYEGHSRSTRRHLADDRFHLIEIGAGDGSLFFSVLRHLRRRVRRQLNYHIVETSSKLEALQRERLAKFTSITWHPEIRSALAACDHRALVFSNELVDAFPATALRRNGEDDRWEEIRLSFHPDSGLVESFHPFPPSSSVFSVLSRSDFPHGQRIELHASYREWLRSWLPSLESGSLLTIDYGDTAENLYHRRPGGTLRAYFKQNRFEGPPGIYARFGKQDLTADVNFTDLIAWGEDSGVKTVNYQSQADFTGESSSQNPDPAAEAANAAFKVLHQRKTNPVNPVNPV